VLKEKDWPHYAKAEKKSLAVEQASYGWLMGLLKIVHI